MIPRMNKKAAHTGRWILITGASSGIGEVFVRRFAREGSHMVLIARSADKLNTLARELETEFGVQTLVVAIDLSLKEAAATIFSRVKENRIQLYGIINNAGFGAGRAFHKSLLEPYLKMIDVNIRALVELTHLFLPGLISQNEGLILNVSSTASYQPIPLTSVYAASKSFVTSFTEALWLELKETKIRVMNLCPGLTKTPFGVSAGLRDFRNDPFAETPEQVVTHAFDAFSKDNPTVISGFHNYLIIWLERFIPHRILLFLVLAFQKSRRSV